MTCIEQSGPLASNGYRLTPGDHRYAHRVAWENAHGEIPEGMVVHHICRNQTCVNPEHLQLMTPSEHARLHARRVEVCPRCGSTERKMQARTRPNKTCCVPCAIRAEKAKLLRRSERSPIIECACGCGTQFRQIGPRGKPRRFARGHKLPWTKKGAAAT